MFALTQHDSTITHLKVRFEQHGKELKPACDIKLTTTGSNDLLDEFEPGMKKAFFRKAAKGKAPMLGEQQPLIEGAEGLVALKYHVIGSFPIQFEREAYEFEIAPLNEGEDPIFHVDVKATDFHADVIEGGSVAISYRLSFPCTPAEFSELIRATCRKQIKLTLTPPSKQDEGQGDAGAAADASTDPDTDPNNRNP